MIFILIGTYGFILPSASEEPGEEIRIGYRSDARPFSWFQEGEFKGFIAELCDGILKSTNFKFRRVPVNSQSRWTKLSSQNPKTRIDVLCDTTSITMERAGKWLFSPVVFLSGVSYAYSPAAEKKQIDTYVQSKQSSDSPSESGAQVDPSWAPYCST